MKIAKWLLVIPMAVVLTWGCSLDEPTGTSNGNGNTNTGDFSGLIINEILASNDAANTDALGGFDDWFEILNTGTDTVNIAGLFVTDDLTNLEQAQIPNTNAAATTILPGGFLVIWCDNESFQGELHVDFALSSGGEDLAIVAPDGISIVDSYTFGPQTTDISIGQNPDASGNWESFSEPTPGESNTGAPASFPPEISNISISPDSLTDATPIIISAKVTDANDDLNTVSLTFGEEGTVNNETAMSLTDSTYSADLGTFADGTRVFFFITATDAEGQTVQSDTLSFEVGFVPPVIFINEFLASNDSCCTDENGEFDDWIEIYNPGLEAIDIGGMYISDDAAEPTVWQIPDTAPDTTTIQPGGFLVLWADKEPEQGVLHVNIKLGSGGEDAVLTAPNGTTTIDSYTFGAQTTDVSMGRQPDGSDNWITFDSPTPGASNN